MSEVCKAGVISKTTVGNLISRTTLDKEQESIQRNKCCWGRHLACSFVIYTILLLE